MIVTLRADFYDRPLIYPRFGELLAARTEAVPPLTPDELEQAIRGPAERVGVRPEPGLVAEMIADVAHQPGALPLLQYALTELFERRNDEGLTLSSYREIGGIAGALSARADRIYEETDHAGRRAIKQVFLRLVTLGEGRLDTRRRIARSELDDIAVDPATIDVVDRHVRTASAPDVRSGTRHPGANRRDRSRGAAQRVGTAAHLDRRRTRGSPTEPRIWPGPGRNGKAPTATRASSCGVRDWTRSKRGPRRTDLAIGRPERAYLKASVDQRDREREEEERRREHEARIERRSARRLRGLVAVFAAAALIAGTLTVVATNQQRQGGSAEARIATARELAAAAVANLEVDPELGVLLATEAVETTRSSDGTVLPEAEEALHRAVVASRLELEVPGLEGSSPGARTESS